MTTPFEPPLTLARVAERVRELREQHRTDSLKLAKGPDWYAHNRVLVAHYQDACAVLRANVLYMMAWHRIDGDLVEIARELEKLAELLPEGA